MKKGWKLNKWAQAGVLAGIQTQKAFPSLKQYGSLKAATHIYS